MYLLNYCLRAIYAEEVRELAADQNSRKTPASGNKNSWQKDILLYIHDLTGILAVIMLVFLLLFRIVIVSGSSMCQTLRDGDWLLLISGTFYREPEYGDIIVACKDSFNDGEPIIKRVIATEGQTVDIDFDAGIVYVDGKALDEPYTYTPTNYPEGMIFPLTVEEGCVFALGDNRNNSLDSRNPHIGHIDKREILGRAFILVFPGTGEGENESPRDYTRIGVLTNGR